MLHTQAPNIPCTHACSLTTAQKTTNDQAQSRLSWLISLHMLPHKAITHTWLATCQPITTSPLPKPLSHTTTQPRNLAHLMACLSHIHGFVWLARMQGVTTFLFTPLRDQLSNTQAFIHLEYQHWSESNFKFVILDSQIPKSNQHPDGYT